jgi:hypothetical protein
MNISTVANNLRNTIAGKESLLAAKKKKLVQRPVLSDDLWFATKATIEFLEINIAELTRILRDVEQLQPSWTPSNCPYAEDETCHRMD